MRRGRLILLVLLGLAVLHGAIWFALACVVRSRLDRAVTAAAGRGIDLRVGARTLTGYPWTAGVALSGFELGPAGVPLGARLATDRAVVALTLSPWSPTLRLSLPATVTLLPPDGRRYGLSAADARIGAPCCHPTAFAFAAEQAVVSVDDAVLARIGRLGGTVRPDGRVLTLDADGAALVVDGRPLDPAVATASATLTFDGPALPPALPPGQAGIDALIAWRDGGGGVRVDRAAVGWGPLDAEAEARLTLDPLLQAAGAGEVRLAGGSQALDTLAAAGLLAPRAAQAARAVLALLPADAAPVGPGRRPAVQVPVRLTGGRISLGGFPVVRVAPWTLP